MKLLKTTLLLAAIIVAGTGIIKAQDVKQMADSHTFQFQVKSATLGNNNEATMSSGFMENGADMSHKHINASGLVTVKPDSISSTLPYFDDAQVHDGPVNNAGDVTVNLNVQPTKFSAKQYDCNVQQKKKGDVQIDIKPKDNNAVEKFTFNIKPDGTGTLVVNIDGVKRITYEGSIVK